MPEGANSTRRVHGERSVPLKKTKLSKPKNPLNSNWNLAHTLFWNIFVYDFAHCHILLVYVFNYLCGNFFGIRFMFPLAARRSTPLVRGINHNSVLRCVSTNLIALLLHFILQIGVNLRHGILH